MSILKLNYSTETINDEENYCLSKDEFNKFNSSLLNLGDISKDGEYFEALAAIFDLEGFTSFCTQIDPHLVIPEFMSEFLSWIFNSITKELVRKNENDKIVVWSHLPIYAKFMGDGVLFVWDTRGLELETIGNIVVSLHNICKNYIEIFLQIIKKNVVKPPLKLRCGIARGQIISIGDGNDFVGPCINVAARLQKLGQFSFAFSKRGFSLERCFSDQNQKKYMLIKSQIRGVGEEELIFVKKDEYDMLSTKEKEQFAL